MVDFSKIIDYFLNSPIPENMLRRGQTILNDFLGPMKVLLEQKAVPREPWSDEQIEVFLAMLSNMDTDKDSSASRVGEREARIASKIHLKTSAGFCHGVGRSGYLSAPQPKAPGASIMYELSNYLARNFFKTFGLPRVKGALVVPLATGMSLALTLSALKPKIGDPENEHKKCVIVPQIDHKSLLKALEFVGMTPKIAKGKVSGDAVRIPFEDVTGKYDDSCFAVLSFTSYFPPREHDAIKEISKFAREKDLVHVIVNAYGVQSPEWMKLIRVAMDAGRVDAVIQSTDKNFLTPVGGSVIVSPNKNVVDMISQAYAGRACATPVVNFLVAMLSLGVSGYQRLVKEQQENRELLEVLLKSFADSVGERVMNIFNPVAVSMSLKRLKENQRTALGGALYNLRVTGPRVFNPSQSKFGACSDEYSVPYIVMNAAIGATKEDVTSAVKRLEKAYQQVVK
ncbi:MAG: O-phosphoseryl-tRNA(Sec) selenium transferase [Candidatus Lokiarchaeota archaeon]|nr:O-phosphoseryl-tRNA(Sec) selenium transferase [Candidatus Lokiarchaeota archaeon]